MAAPDDVTVLALVARGRTRDWVMCGADGRMKEVSRKTAVVLSYEDWPADSDLQRHSEFRAVPLRDRALGGGGGWEALPGRVAEGAWGGGTPSRVVWVEPWAEERVAAERAP